MEPIIQGETPVVYLEGKCWYGRRRIYDDDGRLIRNASEICGVGARLYQVRRAVTIEIPGPSVSMWLCDRHVKAMSVANYVVTEVHEP